MPLKVLQPQSSAQDCSTCQRQFICYAPKIKAEHIILNLLTCRIKRGIDVSRSSKMFLAQCRKMTWRLAKQAVKGTNIDLAVATADIESYIIEVMQNTYTHGEIFYPLPFLFSPFKGRATFFVANYARKTRKFGDTHLLQNEYENPNWDGAPEPEVEEQDTDVTRRARAIIEDGVTLNLEEYRVLKFCMTNAKDAKRPLNGLHVYLALVGDIPRIKCTQIYSTAIKKLTAQMEASN